MLLEVKDLTCTLRIAGADVPIVDQVSFNLQAGKCLALVGESGCGKSMTALSLLRLQPKVARITSGQVLLNGKNLLDYSVPQMYQVRGREISMIFQEPMTSLNPVIRVGEQVKEAVLLHERVSSKAARARSLDLFKRVKIPEPEQRFDAYPHQLSGGLKQRVMIAMALATQPKVLLADEPTTALDVTIQMQILELLRELQREFHTAVLLITHDLGVVNQIADDIAVMYAGRIVEMAERRALLTAPSHPYTRGLLGALPGRAAPKAELSEIMGAVPSPAHWPSGCRFRPRCPEAMERCAQAFPELVQLGETKVACYARQASEELR
jgi:peptide/nickel transport system ATP-binding protein